MIPDAAVAYHYLVLPEQETNGFVHGNDPDYSPQNVTVYQSAIPHWVSPVDLPIASIEEDLQTPYQLFDCQIDTASQTTYIRQVYKIWNAFDLENLSNFSIAFDPSFQTLRLHECNIYRNGTCINKLDMNELRIIQPENRLNNNIYDARLSAIFFLEDIRNDDLIEYSYSIKGSRQKEFYLCHPLQDIVRWEKMSLQIFKSYGQSLQSKITPSNWGHFVEDRYKLSWDIEPCPAADWEPDLPTDYPLQAQIEINEYATWHIIAEQEASLCLLKDDFRQNPEVKKLVNCWKRDSTTLEEQALLAIRYVQDEIRYTGIETGKAAYIATDALTTFERRFGDCKGKSQLLRAFLDLLGIHSELCLVNTRLRNTIKNYLPNPQLFDHAILWIDFPSQTAFVDATALYQGGHLSQLGCPFEAGLILSKETQNLVDIPSKRIHPEIDCQTQFTINSNDPVTMNMTIHFYGYMADIYRASSKYRAIYKPNTFYKYLQSLFGQIESLSSSQVQDERLHNHITVSINLLLKNPWIPSQTQSNPYFVYMPYFLSKYLTQTIDQDRQIPIELPTARIKETVSVVGGTISQDSKTIKNEIFKFESRISSDKAEIDLFSYTNTLPPKNFNIYLDALDNALYESEIMIEKTAKSSSWWDYFHSTERDSKIEN